MPLKPWQLNWNLSATSSVLRTSCLTAGQRRRQSAFRRSAVSIGRAWLTLGSGNSSGRLRDRSLVLLDRAIGWRLTWLVKYCSWLKAGNVYGGIAIHGYVSVPVYPASHGCIRVATWTMDELYPKLPVGLRVLVY